MLELEEAGVPPLYHDGGERELPKPLHLEGDCPVRERGTQVLQTLSFHRGHHRSILPKHGVVAAGRD
ncbi:MAG TPA: hypothetical protein VEQ37_17340 [Actinomycetota bacterium]|nr:hypothetical protein [Actinomycetota bacterium]